MLTAVIHLQGAGWHASSSGTASTSPATGSDAPATSEATTGTEEHVPAGDLTKPGPIVPEMKELAWGAGSFIVLAVLMRWFLFPRLKRSMDARYQGIQADHAAAESARQAARTEVADYEAQVAAIRAEANQVVDAARNEVEAERQAKVAALQASLGEQRSAAAAEAEAARQAAQSQIAAAVGDVAGRAGELATGRRPADDVVSRVVSEVMAR